MNDRDNALLQGTIIPKPSRYARYAAAIAVLTLAAIIVSATLNALGYTTAARMLAYAQLAFPAAIILGHLALREIARANGRLTGRPLALLGLYIGYFNLILTLLILFRL